MMARLRRKNGLLTPFVIIQRQRREPFTGLPLSHAPVECHGTYPTRNEHKPRLTLCVLLFSSLRSARTCDAVRALGVIQMTRRMKRKMQRDTTNAAVKTRYAVVPGYACASSFPNRHAGQPELPNTTNVHLQQRNWSMWHHTPRFRPPSWDVSNLPWRRFSESGEVCRHVEIRHRPRGSVHAPPPTSSNTRNTASARGEECRSRTRDLIKGDPATVLISLPRFLIFTSQLATPLRTPLLLTLNSATCLPPLLSTPSL